MKKALSFILLAGLCVSNAFAGTLLPGNLVGGVLSTATNGIQCFSESLPDPTTNLRVAFKWCVRRPLLDPLSTKVVYYFHREGENERTFLDSQDFRNISSAWRNLLGKKDPYVISVSFGETWLLTTFPSGYVEGAPNLLPFFNNVVMPYVEKKAMTPLGLPLPLTPTVRTVMGDSIGAYNAAQLLNAKDAAQKSLVQKAVLGCPAFFTVSPFDSGTVVHEYALQTGADLQLVFNLLSALRNDFWVRSEWISHDPIEFAKQFSAQTPAMLIWYNEGDEYGLHQGARTFVDTALSRGARVSHVSNTGNHCLRDSGINSKVAEFLYAN